MKKYLLFILFLSFTFGFSQNLDLIRKEVEHINNTKNFKIKIVPNDYFVDVKKEATELFNSLGLNMSTAINLFLRKSINEGGIPFELKNPKPTRELKRALKEAKKIENGEIKSKGYHNIDELFEDLNK